MKDNFNPIIILKVVLGLVIVLPILDVYILDVIYGRYLSFQLYLSILVPFLFIILGVVEKNQVLSIVYLGIFVGYWFMVDETIILFLKKQGLFIEDDESVIIDDLFQNIRKVTFTVVIVLSATVQLYRKLKVNKR